MSESVAGTRPRVLVLGTGGTIAGSGASAQGHSYVAGELPVEDLLAAVPALAEVARLRSESMFQVDSVEMDLPRQLVLARRVTAALADPEVDGVVITHGTDTMEETAYFLHLTVRTTKPVVLVGAMRPADATSADGPGNLLGAVRVAADPRTADWGVLVVVGEEVHGARDVRKEHTTRVAAFGSAHGPVGEIGLSGVQPRALPTRAAAVFAADLADPERLADVADLPPVEVVVTHAAQPAAVLEAILATGVRGLVHVGPGAGNVSAGVAEVLDRAVARGVAVVRSSRVGRGAVHRNDAVPDDAHGWVAGDDLPPFKARILLALGLTRSADPAVLQRLFDTC